MKVLLINGSPRKNGNTFTALSEIANTLKTEGIESEIVWIGNKPVRGCIACGTCKTKGNGRCIFDDDVCNSISAKFAESDGLSLVHRSIMASRTVLFSPSCSVRSSPTALSCKTNLQPW